MGSDPEPFEPDDWESATSRPGELYTVEGEIRMAGRFARGAKDRDPRLREHRRSMRRTGLYILGAGIATVILASVVAAIF